MNMNVIDFYTLLSVITLNRRHWRAEPERNFVAQQQGPMLCEMNPGTAIGTAKSVGE